MPAIQSSQFPLRDHHRDRGMGGDGYTTVPQKPTSSDGNQSDTNRSLERDRPYYKPTALRWPFLAVLLCILITALLVLIYGICTLPGIEGRSIQPSGGVEARGLDISTGSPSASAKQTKPVQEFTLPSQVGPTRNSARTATLIPESTIWTTSTDAVGTGEYGHVGYQTVTTTATEIATQIVTVTLTMTITDTAPGTIITTGGYGEIGYQTITELITETATKAATETIRITEIIIGTTTETVFTAPPKPSSLSNPTGGHGDVEVITVTNPSASAALSTPRRDPTDASNEDPVAAGSLTSHVFTTSSPAADFGGSDHENTAESSSSVPLPSLSGEWIQFQGSPVATDAKTKSTERPESNTITTRSRSSEMTAITEYLLYDTTGEATGIETITNPHITEIGVVITDARGSPITTSTARVFVLATQVESGFDGLANHIMTLGVTTLTDANGSPTATLTVSPNPITTLATATLANAAGQPISTSVWTTLITPTLSVETDSRGVPTATIASYPIPPTTKTIVYYISLGQYFVGMFLPTIVASGIAILVRTLSTNAKIFQPWHALTRDHGAFGRDSLCLQTGGWQSIVASVRSLLDGQAVTFFTNILLVSSAVLVPLSAETIALDLRGDGCKTGSRNCAWVLSASLPASKATITLLVLMSVMIVLLLVLLGRWSLGVYTNPRSISTLASLSSNNEVQQLVTGSSNPLSKRDKSLIAGRRFKLGHSQHIHGRREYGVIPFRGSNDSESRGHERGSSIVTPDTRQDNKPSKNRHSMPFFMLRYLGRFSLLFMICGVLVLIIYYSQTGGNTAFERFLDSNSFGVRFLFTSFGVIISFMWSSFFDGVAILSPYQLLAHRPQIASRSILLAPPTNAFSGLWYAVRTRHVFIGFISLASALSEFLGIFLSNVPFQVTQTYLVFQVSFMAAVGILSFMALVIFMSFFVKWPYMPADPSTIAGAMYYVCDSPMLDNFEGLSMLKRRERDHMVTELSLHYEFGETKGISGEVRTIVKTSDTDSSTP
ncbi:hypothetical protein EKO27_g1535 [Xylaria grammica]|uniref:Uncharacterized protein n=1 Tax=Xylaria grammica TaxID=363999 RepID=A0A439DGJ3_9PEZI|nr:hypothetical protein EKO27_g1535 [Xylaria grammica]